jgi:hypothetical protein
VNYFTLTAQRRGQKSIKRENARVEYMSNANNGGTCYFCKTGRFIERTEEIAFKQWTDKGYVFCTVKLRVGVCDHCDSRDWNAETEAVIREVVRKERDKLK